VLIFIPFNLCSSYEAYNPLYIDFYNLIPVTCCEDPVPSPPEFWQCSNQQWRPACEGSGTCTVNGSVIVLSTGQVFINNAFVVGGNLTRTILIPVLQIHVSNNLFSVQGTINLAGSGAISVSACADTSQGTVVVDLNQLTGSGEQTIISGLSSCSLFGAVNVTNAGNSCYSVQNRTNSNTNLASLVLIFDTSPGCADGSSEGPAAPDNTAIIAGAVVGGVVGLTLIIVVILLAVPATRKKILPYRGRKNEKQNTL